MNEQLANTRTELTEALDTLEKDIATTNELVLMFGNRLQKLGEVDRAPSTETPKSGAIGQPREMTHLERLRILASTLGSHNRIFSEFVNNFERMA